MKPLLILALLAAAPALPAAAAFEDEALSEEAVSTDTVRNGDDEEAQPVLQQNDEDLAAFVTDYIRKDIQLKGSFLMDSKAEKKVLKLDLVSVDGKPLDGENGVRKVRSVFKDAAGRRYQAVFHLQSGPWGGLDIFKIELKAEPAQAKDKK